MKLDKYRSEIEAIDKKIIELVKQRLKVSKEIGNYKKENNLPILNLQREQTLLNNYKLIYNDNDTWNYYKEIFKVILKTSKDYQNE